MNRVEIDEGGGDDGRGATGARPKHRKKLYDLNVTDGFWMAQKGRCVAKLKVGGCRRPTTKFVTVTNFSLFLKL